MHPATARAVTAAPNHATTVNLEHKMFEEVDGKRAGSLTRDSVGPDQAKFIFPLKK